MIAGQPEAMAIAGILHCTSDAAEPVLFCCCPMTDRIFAHICGSTKMPANLIFV